MVQQDAIRAQLERSALRSELITLEREKQQLRARLNAWLAREPGATLAEPLALRPMPALSVLDAAALAQRARVANPQLQVEAARLRGAEHNRDLTLRNRYPDFQVGISPKQMGSRLTTWSLMIEMNIPLQRDTRRAQEREAGAMVDAAQARTQALSNQLLGELGEQLAGIEAARRSEALISTQLLPQSELSLRSALAANESGKVDFATLFDAQRQIRQARLANWDMSPEQNTALVKIGEVRRSISFRSPVAGIVTEKKALQGMRFMPGEALYQVTDLASVWVMADVFEQDIAQIRLGAMATVRLNAYPEQRFQGRITYIYPTLNAETRTVPVRVELANPRQLLKPAMFAQVELQVGGGAKVLTVPESAVIDTGTRRMVLVQLQEGRFEPREVQLGERSDTHVQVLTGLREGEQVVVAANFLIDAESNLQAVIGGMAAPAAAAAEAKPAVVGHRDEGKVDDIDRQAGTLSLSHGAIASLKWPAMTMDFQLANPALLKGLRPGTAVSFEFVERQPGEWVITTITPTARNAGTR